ncbi:MAG: hypothetical protein ACFB6R_10405 [Alphaproteobacteria bacterium]
MSTVTPETANETPAGEAAEENAPLVKDVEQADKAGETAEAGDDSGDSND